MPPHSAILREVISNCRANLEETLPTPRSRTRKSKPIFVSLRLWCLPVPSLGEKARGRRGAAAEGRSLRLARARARTSGGGSGDE
eukprot:4719958-Pleurochrysis_carterae.AAC.1